MKRNEIERKSVENIIETLLEAGFMPCGTRESRKIIAQRSHPLPEAIANRKQKFRLPGTKHRVTVGRKTTCLYEVVDGEAREFQKFHTVKKRQGICLTLLALGVEQDTEESPEAKIATTATIESFEDNALAC